MNTTRDSFGRRLAEGMQCPDCDSEIVVREISPGLLQAVMMHDDTCPWISARDERIHRAKAAVRRHEGEK